MSKKKIFSTMLFLVAAGFLFVAKESYIRDDTKNTSTVVQQSQVQLESITFENKRFHYVFDYPAPGVQQEEIVGRGADFSSDIDSVITMKKNGATIFNVTRLFLDEKTIQEGIKSNTSLFANQKDIESYATRINDEYSVIRFYRDLSFRDFVNILKKQNIFDPSSVVETTVDGLPAVEFVFLKQNSFSSEVVSLIKLGYAFVSDFGVHKVVFFESPIGEKYYIHYRSEDPVSNQMFKSFHFIK